MLWELAGTLAETVDDSGLLTSVTTDREGKLLAVGDLLGTVTVRDVTGATEPVTFTTPGLVNALSLSPDRTRIAVGMPGASVLVWDLGAGAEVRTLVGPSDKGAVSVAHSPDGALIAAGLFDGSVVVWDARDGHQVAFLPPEFPLNDPRFMAQVVHVAFGADSRTLAYTVIDGVVLWDVASGSERARLLTPSGLTTTSLAFSPDGSFLAQGGQDSTVVLWDPQRPAEPVAVLAGQDSTVNAVAFSADGLTLASGGSDGGVILWDVVQGSQRAELGDGGEIRALGRRW